MVYLTPCLILPLVDHLVKKRLHRFIPSMPANVAPADHYLGWMPSLTAQRIVSEPRFHSSRNSNWNRGQLAIEFRMVQLAMCPRELTHKVQIGGAARSRILLRLEVEGKLSLASRKKFSQRSKQRCGPGTNVRLSSDQILVVTSIVFLPMLITFTDEGRPPRDRLDTVPAVEITVPFRVCSM